jgi:transitional endoplasmic reticulum ATPase
VSVSPVPDLQTWFESIRSLFDDPDREERVLYCKYWQGKVQHNKDVDFPDSLVEDVADITESFSFAYLKEAL